MSKKLSQDSELQTLTLSPSSPNSPPLPSSGHPTEQFGPHCFNNPSSSHEVSHKERSGNAKTKNEKCEKGSSHNAKAKQVVDDSNAGQAGKVNSDGQAGRVSSGGQAGKICSGGQTGRLSSAGQAARVSSGGQAGKVSSGGSGHTTSTRSVSKDANSSSAATNVTVMLQQAPPPSQMAAHHSKQHQSLVQSSSMQNTPKRKTERVLSAPGNAAAVISSSKAYNKPTDTGAALDSNVGPVFHPHHPTQQQHPSRPVLHHPPLVSMTRSRAPQPNLTTQALTTHGGVVRSDGTPASGRSAGSPLPPPPSSTRGSATSSPFRQYASSTSFSTPPQRSPPQAERIELGHLRNPLAKASTHCASHTTATDSSPYAGPTVATTSTSHSVTPSPHLVTRLNPTIHVPGSGLAINCVATPISSVNTVTVSSTRPQQNITGHPFSVIAPGKTQTTHDLVSIQSSPAVPVSRASIPAPVRSSHPIKLESLQGNIILHIKPEAIHSTNTRPAHTALLIEPESGPGFIPAPRVSPGKRVAMPQLSPSRGEPPYASMAVPGTSTPPEPLRPSTETTTRGNIGGGNEKPTSLLTQLLSQSTKGSSSRSASDILKFWVDSRTPKKPNYGSNVALAGSNGSNSDSNASELSEESSNAGKSLLQSDYFCKNSSSAGFTSGLASENSSTQAFGSHSSLNPSASAGNVFLPRKETRNNLVSEESRGLLMSEPLLEPRYHKDWFATELSRFADEEPLDIRSSAQAPLNPDSLLDDDDDDDEAWFDSVTKLNEQWFRPGKNNTASSITMTATPVGKSDVARMSGFGGLGRNRGGTIGGGGSSSLIGRSSTATDLHQKMGSLSRLQSSSSYAGLTTPLAGLPTRGLSTTTPQSALTLSTKPTRSTLDLTNLNCDKSGASNSSTNATFGSNAALANTSTSNLSSRFGNLNLASNRSNIAALRKVLHQRGLYQRRLHTKTHANLIKTNIDDAGAVKEIEAGLLHLMEEFQAGNLAAFGKDSRLRQMEAIREQQESLARLHQEVGVRQDLYQPLSAEGLQNNSEHMSTLMGKLECLSESIENLHSNASCDRKASTSDATVVPPTAGGTSSSHTVDDKSGTTSNAKEGTVDDAGVELRKKSNNRGTLHKTSSLGGAGGGGRENGIADVAATDGNGALLDRSRISKGGGASFVRSSSQKHMEYSRGPVAAVVSVTRGNSFTNGVVSTVGGGFDMNNRSRSKSKGKRNTENDDRSAIERAGKTKQAAKNDEHQRHRHRKHTKERDGLQTSGEPCVIDANCFAVPSLNAGADFREGTEMKQFGNRKAPNKQEALAAGLQQHQFIIADGRAPDPTHRVDVDSLASDSTHPAPVVEHRHHHHTDRHSRLVSKKTAPSHLHQPERASMDLKKPSPSLQRQPPFVPARPSRTAPPLALGAGHPPLLAVEGESPSISGRPVKPTSSRSTPLPVLP